MPFEDVMSRATVPFSGCTGPVRFVDCFWGWPSRGGLARRPPPRPARTPVHRRSRRQPPCRSSSAILAISCREKRRWPPRVTICGIRPASDQRRSVFGDIISILAASRVVMYSDSTFGSPTPSPFPAAPRAHRF